MESIAKGRPKKKEEIKETLDLHNTEEKEDKKETEEILTEVPKINGK
jgi:hypothetical protein